MPRGVKGSGTAKTTAKKTSTRAKKTETKAAETAVEEVKADAAVSEAPEAEAAEKESAEKKVTRGRKTTAAKAEEKTPAQRAKRVAVQTATQPKVFLEYGENSIALDDILKKAEESYKSGRKKTFNDLRVYIKPEENAAYYVADEKNDSIDIWD